MNHAGWPGAATRRRPRRDQGFREGLPGVGRSAHPGKVDPAPHEPERCLGDQGSRAVSLRGLRLQRTGVPGGAAEPERGARDSRLRHRGVLAEGTGREPRDQGEGSARQQPGPVRDHVVEPDLCCTVVEPEETRFVAPVSGATLVDLQLRVPFRIEPAAAPPLAAGAPDQAQPSTPRPFAVSIRRSTSG